MSQLDACTPHAITPLTRCLNSKVLALYSRYVESRERTLYYHEYVQAMLMAVQEGVKLLGCSAWSLADNFDWRAGYSVRFGIQYVNLTTQERFYKASFF
ncbi:glycoside hydrolase [Aspergillus tubingensis]|uniref:glycoside hydrolase n=1 Tax=Aspergillus tubingensis TaxID=5068 RepID=UPI001578D390|nr:glycoside hydrolase [Aspergillus tubingensis]GFN16720.1 glycoside hydrolase [Aspergillus tubingensis]